MRHPGSAAGIIGAAGLIAMCGIVLLSGNVIAQGPTIPSGAPRPGVPAPRVQMPARDNPATPTGTARIRGQIVSADTGAPLRRAVVRISSGELRINRSVNTDADGRYEAAELPAGRYNIFVTRNGYVSLQFGQRRPFESGRPLDVAEAQVVDKIDFALPRGGVIAGRITDELGEPLAGIRMQAMRHQYLPNGQRQLVPAATGFFTFVTNDLGEFRLYGLMPGAYIISGSPSDAMVMLPGVGAAASDFEGHGTTYYPGTLSADEAQPVAVGLAEEAHASFALIAARMTTISGIVRSSTGQPVPNVMLGLRSRSGGGGFAMRSAPGVASDGSFSIGNVPPGNHWIEVVPRPGNDEAASMPITADGTDITGLVITTSPGATVSGRVIFDGTSAQKPARIVLTPADPFGSAPMMRGMDANQGTIGENGQFEIKGAFGRVLFAAAGAGFGPAPAGWSVKSVTFNGSNITEMPLDISTVGSVSGIEIVLTDKQTTLSGTVRTPQGPVSDYTVAIFPETPREGMSSARYVRVARPDQQGRFETRGLPPGDYLAVAVESLEQGGQWDPAFRKQVEPVAKRFRLAEGMSLTIELPLMQ